MIWKIIIVKLPDNSPDNLFVRVSHKASKNYLKNFSISQE